MAKVKGYIKNYKRLVLLSVFFVVVLIFYLHFINSPQFEQLKNWAQQHFVLYFSSLVFLKALAIVWPPILGTILTLGSVPIIGWFNSLVADMLGNLIGSSIAYYLARRYGYNLLKSIFDERLVTKIENLKIKNGKEVESITVLRMLTSGAGVEVISYGAGLIGVDYTNFILGTVLANLLVGIPVFFFIENAFTGQNIILNLIVLSIAIPAIWKLKGRYFE